MRARQAYAILVFFIALGLVVGFILLRPKASGQCSETYRTDKVISVNGHSLNVQVTQNEAEQEKGLGGKRCIGSEQAMLFQFGAPGYYPFWMKDMKFPIDIVWLDANHNAVWSQSNISPATYPKNFTNQSAATDTLELKAGQAQSFGIQTGSHFNY